MRIKVFVHRAVACPENTELRIEIQNGSPREEYRLELQPPIPGNATPKLSLPSSTRSA